ncbi:tigger transposable element-derived protein 6-like protein [Elysia marginata]|uniref:Tigger transposable element-derived protein 6-like protein n=1 Tax=Elysia marginata TaxID=1093978 RepID=A0AAV4EME6_9GAST|nr:tigger transposable element-derived protein 6-like protein [Elysia marginata]
MANQQEQVKYTQEMLEEAVDLVRHKAISLNEASRSFGIPLSTLGDKVRGRRPIKARSKFLLTSEEEQRVVDVLYAQRSLGRTVDDLKLKVKEVLELRGDEGRRGDGLPGKDWVLSFRKRHPELSIRTPQALGKERALITAEDVERWFAGAKAYLDSQDPDLLKSADRLYNADETGFSLSPCAKRIIAPTGIKHQYSLSNSKRQNITVLTCGGASGEFVKPFLVYARKRMPATNLLEGFDNAYLQISHNGWMNAQIFKTWVNDIFIPHVASKKKPVVLFVDRHSSHNSDRATIQLCNDNSVILYGLLAHASHIVQPLDLTVFASMKAEWSKAVHRHLEQTGEVATSAATARPTARRTLDSILAPPQLQRNKSGKVTKKSSSLTMAFSSEEHRSFLKSKEDNAKAEEERKKQNKINREQMKEKKLREKREKQEQRKAEQEKKKADKEKKMAEKRKLMEDRKLARLLKSQEKKKKIDSDTSGSEEENMVLESDGEPADDVMLNVNACVACGDEEGDVD